MNKLNKIILIISFIFFINLLVSCNKTKEFTINLDSDGGSVLESSITVKENESFPKLPTPEKPYYIFEGWFGYKNGIEILVYNNNAYLDDGIFKSSSYDINNASIQLHAKYSKSNEIINVNIKFNNSSSNITHKVKFGETIPELSKPTKEFAIFKGWYTTINGKEYLVHNGDNYVNDYAKLDTNNYQINNNVVTIYAKYEDEKFKCRINLIGNTTEFEDLTILSEYGKKLDDLPIPTKDNYKFVGWYLDINNNDSLVYDETGFYSNYSILNGEHYPIKNREIYLYAKYEPKQFNVVFKYNNRGYDEEKTVKVPYDGTILDYAPTGINEYGETVQYCWARTTDSSIEDIVETIKKSETLYSVGTLLKYNNIYSARKSLDGSELLIDFRTSENSNINSTYTASSNAKKIVFIGNPSKTYSNFNVVISATPGDVELKLIDFKFSASSNKIGIDATGISNNVKLIITAQGNSAVYGGNGTNGSSGASYNRDKETKTPRSGGNGSNGTTGQSAIVCNNIVINIPLGGSLKLVGGSGGNGGSGGHGEGSASDGIAQAGHGGYGGTGGAGGSGIEIRYSLILNSTGNFDSVGGNGGNGGNGGSGGHNKDTGFFDRADHGGHGRNGGTGGHGGTAILINENVEIIIEASNTFFATGGKGGNGGNGGDGGKSCTNELQSGAGGRPGDAGNGGHGGNGGNSVIGINIPIITKGGIGGTGGTAGTPGSADGKVGAYGSNGNTGNTGI